MSQAVISSNKSLSIRKTVVNYSSSLGAFGTLVLDIFFNSSDGYIELDSLSVNASNPSGTNLQIYSPDINEALATVTAPFYYSRLTKVLSGQSAYPLRIPPGCTLRLNLTSISEGRSFTIRALGTNFINSP